MVQAETAEPADLDALAACEALGKYVEDRLHDDFCVPHSLRTVFRDALDQFRFRHCCTLLFRR